MIDELDIRPDDRVLLVSIPAIELVLEIAARLERGLVVGLGSWDEVRQARKGVRGLTNTMFQPGSPGEIPWQSGYFTTVIDFGGGWLEPRKAASEAARVQAPGGTLWVRRPDHEALSATGLKPSRCTGEIHGFLPSK
jgi:hypothetical protein